MSIWGCGGRGVAKLVVLEGQKSEFIGENRPKVGGQKLRNIERFEEAVDASDAIRVGLS